MPVLSLPRTAFMDVGCCCAIVITFSKVLMLEICGKKRGGKNGFCPAANNFVFANNPITYDGFIILNVIIFILSATKFLLCLADKVNDAGGNSGTIQGVIVNLQRCLRQLLAKRAIGGPNPDKLSHNRSSELGMALQGHNPAILRDHRLVRRMCRRRQKCESCRHVMHHILMQLLDPLFKLIMHIAVMLDIMNSAIKNGQYTIHFHSRLTTYHGVLLPKNFALLSKVSQGPTQL